MARWLGWIQQKISNRRRRRVLAHVWLWADTPEDVREELRLWLRQVPGWYDGRDTEMWDQPGAVVEGEVVECLLVSTVCTGEDLGHMQAMIRDETTGGKISISRVWQESVKIQLALVRKAHRMDSRT